MDLTNTRKWKWQCNIEEFHSDYKTCNILMPEFRVSEAYNFLNNGIADCNRIEVPLEFVQTKGRMRSDVSF